MYLNRRFKSQRDTQRILHGIYDTFLRFGVSFHNANENIRLRMPRVGNC